MIQQNYFLIYTQQNFRSLSQIVLSVDELSNINLFMWKNNGANISCETSANLLVPVSHCLIFFLRFSFSSYLFPL